MTKTSTKQAIVELKKAAELVVVNSIASQPAEHRTKFQMVAAGVCPNDEAPLQEPVKTKGVGLKLDCSQCGHTWYINKRIKTCGCLTCKGAKRRSMERSNARRNIQSIVKNSGGPFWTRTRDLSLIRNVYKHNNSHDNSALLDHIDAWYNE